MSSNYEDDVGDPTKGVRRKTVKVKKKGKGRKKSGYVYVVEEDRLRDDDPHFYKVGQTKRKFDLRNRDLQTGNPRDLTQFRVSKKLNDVVRAKRQLMVALDKYNCYKELNGGTEWFRVECHKNKKFVKCLDKAMKKLNEEFEEQ